jgi:indolepyruvate ferredoxin oxidoreductase beta subunit
MSKGIWNISLVGVGGQGIILTSDVLARAAMISGYDVKKSEIHGMSQRGGSVISQVRFGEKVASPIVADGTSDVLVAFERVEALRWARLAKPDGRVLVNRADIVPVTVSSGMQPPAQRVEERLAELPGLVVVDSAPLAAEAGNARTANLVIAGALSRLLPLEEAAWTEAIRVRIPEKLQAVNLKAFALGRGAVA